MKTLASLTAAALLTAIAAQGAAAAPIKALGKADLTGVTFLPFPQPQPRPIPMPVPIPRPIPGPVCLSCPPMPLDPVQDVRIPVLR